jgi:UDP-2,3-diacylglucosamine pyrophosphatase LpxH
MIYKTLLLSDVHLGTKDSKAKEVIELLDSTKFERLILVGDIVDGWAISRGSKLTKQHTKLIRKLLKLGEKGVEIIWIRGNHDDFLKDIIPYTLGNIEIREDYTIEVNNKSYYIMHGDAYDVFITEWKWVAKIGSIGYELALWLNRWYNKYRNWRGKPYFSLSKKIKNSVKKATNFINDFENVISDMVKQKGHDGVICGHIHQPEDRMMENGIHYLNCGDWVENLTYITECYEGKFKVQYFYNQN